MNRSVPGDIFFCVCCSRRAAGDLTLHTAWCNTLEPWCSERGSQRLLWGSAEAADLLHEHSAGSSELQKATLGMC